MYNCGQDKKTLGSGTQECLLSQKAHAGKSRGHVGEAPGSCQLRPLRDILARDFY